MNFENKGIRIAIIKNKDDLNKNKLIYNEYDDKKENIKSYFEQLTLDDNEYFELYPSNKGRSVHYVVGQSGSGKSYWTMKYIENYHKLFPKNNIYIFSALTDDATLDKIKYIKRVKLDDKFLNTDLTDIKIFKDTLIIFDDTDTITNRYIHAKVYDILNMLLERGRHTASSVIYTNHLATDGRTTRRILNECHSITFFPVTLSGKSRKYLLMDYIGLTKDELDKVNNIKSRAITILKTYPKIILSQNEIFCLNNN
jgi:hypothetical protein